MAPQTYRYHRECPLHSENGTDRFEFPREVPTRPQNQAGRDLHHQRYDPSQPSGGLYGQVYPERHYKGSSSYAATTFYSSDHELEGDMPAAHVSSVIRGGPYEVTGLQAHHQVGTGSEEISLITGWKYQTGDRTANE